MNLSDVKNAFALTDEDFNTAPLHISAFAAFVAPSERLRFDALIADDMDVERTGVTYKTIARMGYALAAGVSNETFLRRFKQEVDQLAGRTFFAEGRAPQFEIDGVALLGVVAGMVTSVEARQDWLLSVLDRSGDTLKDDCFQSDLVTAAKALLRGDGFDALGSDRRRVAIAQAFGHAAPESSLEAAWTDLLRFQNLDDITEKAINAAVFEACASALDTISLRTSILTDLIKVLERIDTSLSHWTFETKQRVKAAPLEKWEINHEYHVQNLLWSVLKPVFPDLVDEEFLPKVGHVSPRYDLGVPSLHTIIEVKYLKKSGQGAFRKLTEEIAADSALYLAKSTSYKHIIAFVWDETRQTEEYRTLRSGLESIDGIERVIVLPRPSKMGR